jgi:phage/plasmid-like protein (TIGR03299 family)
LGVFQPLVEDGSLSIETAGSLQNGRKVWALARINASSAEVRPGDEVRPYALLSNSHDGSQAVRFGFTPVRVVCNNTLSAAHEGSASQLVRVYHKGDIVANLEKLRKTMNIELGRFEATVEQYKLLNSQEVSQVDMVKYIRLVFPPPKAEVPASASLLDAVLEATPDFDEVLNTTKDIDLNELSRRETAILNILAGGRGSAERGGRTVTFWDAYNAVNEWGLYERGNSDDARLSSAWFGVQKADDQNALQIAVGLVKAAA